jgi:diguanylate cyclase (GGDEF)-like protein
LAAKLSYKLAHIPGATSAHICYDLAHFKAVNDAHGHAAGDLVLRESSTLVQAALQPGHVLARVGGEEFAVLLPQADLATALALAERLRAAVAGHAFMLPGARGEPGVPHRQTISLGVARLGGAMSMGAELLGAADRQLYIAKNGGRNRVSG